jgi:C4-dicarboxylate-specific signal transduction histidine kinase
MRSDRLRSLGEMDAGIAHELNQPLVGVRGLAEHVIIGMDRGWDVDNDKLREKLSRIIEQADRMVHIIDHVRAFAREAGKPDLSNFCVNEVVDSSIEMLGAQFRSHGVDLQTDLTQSLPTVLANPFSLEEVVINLLNNSRDAIESFENGSAGKISVTTHSTQGSSGPEVSIEVSDNGGGVPEDILAKIWDPFFTTKDPDKGTGLGLSISKGIVEEFGGLLAIDSQIGKGTTISIRLPASIES